MRSRPRTLYKVMNNLKVDKALVVLNENDANVVDVRKKHSRRKDGADEYHQRI